MSRKASTGESGSEPLIETRQSVSRVTFVTVGEQKRQIWLLSRLRNFDGRYGGARPGTKPCSVLKGTNDSVESSVIAELTEKNPGIKVTNLPAMIRIDGEGRIECKIV
jgi:hypothetical protein